jgi:hypothetical protein
MGIRDLVRTGVVTAALIAAVPASGESQRFRITYAEPIGIASTAPSPEMRAKSGGEALTFHAYGRKFVLDLQSNAHVLARLSEDDARAFAGGALLKGQLRDSLGSWVRLARFDGILHGAFWDGSELYSIAPARDVASSLVAQPAADAATGHIIYRLSDTQFTVPMVCGVPGHAPSLNPVQAFRDAVSHVQELASTIPTRQIEIALLADFEFTSTQSQDPLERMAARINIVDGIFSEQVDVGIVASQLTAFGANDDPFPATTDFEALLDELSEYRENMPQVRTRGLAHLLTGLRFGNILGVAYRGALCDARFGVGLTSASSNVTIDALVIAHELGHNFGSPHDAETGSACAATPASFLMAPHINSSDRFSACSLQQMAPHVAAAQCIVPARIGDAAIVAPDSVDTHVGMSFEVPVEVQSIGADAVERVIVNTSRGPLVVESASMAGGSCRIDSNQFGTAVVCEVDSIASGSSAVMLLRLRSENLGQYDTTLQVLAANDRNPANDARSFRVSVNPPIDARLSSQPESVQTFVREDVSLVLLVESVGAQPVTHVQLNIPGNITTPIESVVPDRGTCTQTSAHAANCVIGDMNPGETVRAALQLSGREFSGSTIFAVFLQADNDGNSSNNRIQTRMTFQPRGDVTLNGPQTVVVATGDVYTFSIDVNSVATEAVDNVTVTTPIPSLTSLQSASVAGGSCNTAGQSLTCSLGTMPAGTVRPITIVSRASMNPGTSEMWQFVASGTGNDNLGNDTRFFTAVVRIPVDVGMPPVNQTHPHGVSVAEGQAVPVSVSANSLGAAAASDVELKLIAPPGFVFEGASDPSGPGQSQCAPAGDLAICTRGSLAPFTGIGLHTLLHAPATPGQFSLGASVSAREDVNLANNAVTIPLTVHPLIDPRLEPPPAQVTAVVNHLTSFQVTVNGGRHGASNVALRIVNGGGVPIEEAFSAVGNCERVQIEILCSLGVLAPDQAMPVTLRVRPTVEMSGTLGMSLSAAADLNESNNHRSMHVVAEAASDGSLVATPPTINATRQRVFVLGMDVNVNGPTLNQVAVEIALPAGMTLSSTQTGSGLCSIVPGGVRCAGGSFQSSTPYRVRLDVLPTTAGTFTSTARLFASNDTNSQNDQQSVTITVAVPASTDDSDGGGGGGGALGWWMLWLLVSLQVAAIARQRESLARATEGRGTWRREGPVIKPD